MIAKKWLPVALCCVPGLVVTAVVGIGLLVGGVAFLNSPLSAGLLILAMLACPLSMVLMMRSGNRASGHASAMHDCCSPTQPTVDRLAELRERRAALEQELAEWRAK